MIVLLIETVIGYRFEDLDHAKIDVKPDVLTSLTRVRSKRHSGSSVGGGAGRRILFASNAQCPRYARARTRLRRAQRSSRDELVLSCDDVPYPTFTVTVVDCGDLGRCYHPTPPRE